MTHPIWLRGSRKAMERIGFLKLAVLLASPTGASSSEYITEITGRLNTQITIIPDTNFSRWLISNSLAEKDSTLNTRLQFWWVYNNSISQSGWLLRLAIPEYFESLPRKMGLLESDFTISELGRTLLVGLIPDEEKKAFNNEIMETNSPLTLSLGQKIFFLYLILKADGDFILRFLAKMADQLGTVESFSVLDVGKLIPQTLDEMAVSFRGVAFSDEDLDELDNIWKRRDLIERQNEQHIEKEGSGSSREQISIPRLEWLVETGILEKVAPRVYRFSKQGLDLTKTLTNCYSNQLSEHDPSIRLSLLIDRHFFGFALKFAKGNAQSGNTSEMLGLIKEAYDELKGPLGYVRLRCILLLLHARQTQRQSSYFIEYDDALKLIENEHINKPREIYYTVDRLGGEHQVKIGN